MLLIHRIVVPCRVDDIFLKSTISKGANLVSIRYKWHSLIWHRKASASSLFLTLNSSKIPCSMNHLAWLSQHAGLIRKKEKLGGQRITSLFSSQSLCTLVSVNWYSVCRGKYLQATVQKPNLVCGRLILSYYIPSVDSSGLNLLSLAVSSSSSFNPLSLHWCNLFWPVRRTGFKQFDGTRTIRRFFADQCPCLMLSQFCMFVYSKLYHKVS